jgi:hypothetical protein
MECLVQSVLLSIHLYPYGCGGPRSTAFDEMYHVGVSALYLPKVLFKMPSPLRACTSNCCLHANVFKHPNLEPKKKWGWVGDKTDESLEYYAIYYIKYVVVPTENLSINYYVSNRYIETTQFSRKYVVKDADQSSFHGFDPTLVLGMNHILFYTTSI